MPLLWLVRDFTSWEEVEDKNFGTMTFISLILVRKKRNKLNLMRITLQKIINNFFFQGFDRSLLVLTLPAYLT